MSRTFPADMTVAKRRQLRLIAITLGLRYVIDLEVGQPSEVFKVPTPDREEVRESFVPIFRF